MVLPACLLWTLFGHKVACHTQGVLVEGDDFRVEQDLQLLQPQLPAGIPRSTSLQWLSEMLCLDTRHTQPCLPFAWFAGLKVRGVTWQGAPEIGPNDERRLDQGPQRKVRLLLVQAQQPISGRPHL